MSRRVRYLIWMLAAVLTCGPLLLAPTAGASTRHTRRQVSRMPVRLPAHRLGDVKARALYATTKSCAGREATIVGTKKADVLRGTNGNDVIVGLGGNDTIKGRGGIDWICAGGGKDSVNGGADGDWIYDGPGDDKNNGGLGYDAISYFLSANPVTANLGTRKSTGSGNDTNSGFEALEGSTFDDTITGDALPNWLYGGPGDDEIRGGGGYDTASYYWSAGPIIASLATSSASGDGIDHFKKIQQLEGSGFDDLLIGDEDANWIYGSPGDDDMRGGGGQDTVSFYYAGGPVSASLETGTATGDGSDSIAEVENLEGSIYDDVITGDDTNNWLYGAGGNDQMDGGEGYDGASYYYSPVGVTASLQSGTASGDGSDMLVGFEQLEGSYYNDTLVGDANHNWLYGGNGDDQLNGGDGYDGASFYLAFGPITVDLAAGTATGEGNDSLTAIEKLDGSAYGDTFLGDAANNIFFGRAGDDEFDGRAGIDVASYALATGPITADLATGTATGEGNDSFVNMEGLFGGFFDDILRGDAGPNYLFGDFGNDQLDGRDGADVLDGGDGSNQLVGGGGLDNCSNGPTISACEGSGPIPELFGPVPFDGGDATERRHY